MNRAAAKTLWIVSELFYPEETSTGYIMTKIASYLSSFRNVQVICGPIYDMKNSAVPGKTIKHEFQLTRVQSLPLDKNKYVQRILRLIILSVQLSFKLLMKAKKGDDVLIVTNPAPLILLIVFVCRLKGLKCYTIVHDVFPENLIAGHMMNHKNVIYKLLNSVFNWAYSKMAVLFVLGRDMETIFQAKLSKFKIKPKVFIIENWGETEEIYPQPKSENEITKKYCLEDKVIFQFAGNMGRLQGLLELCEIISVVKNPLIHFMFIGNGAVRSKMENMLTKSNLNNFTFIDSLPRNAQNTFLNSCDIGIVSLQAGMTGLGVPSKSYNILSAGKPILFLGDDDSEIAQMIKDHEVGWCFNNAERAQLIDFLNSFSKDAFSVIADKGAAARALAVSKYSHEHILGKFKAFMDGE